MAHLYVVLMACASHLRARVSSSDDREAGATAVEYGLMVALIAIVIIVAVKFLGGNLNNDFSNVGNNVAVGAN